MANGAKDVIYIDADEEITGIIDMVRSSSKQLVALVLPKRAAMLQSSVNMKLLKKSADSAKKHLVLVTTESSLLPLASSVGLYVARNLDSKPEIPGLGSDDSQLDDLVAADDNASEEDFDPSDSSEKPIGELANLPEEPATAAKAASAKKFKPELTPRPIPRATDPDEDETIELDNTVPETDLAAAAAETAKPEKGKKLKNKRLGVPNFDKFRLRLILAALLLIILVVGFILANIVLPKATVTIATKTSGVSSNLTLNLSTGASKVDPSNGTIPAHLQQDKKSQSQQVATTGQQNEGAQAAGSITLSEPCSDVPNSQQIPAGTGVSSNGLTFITQSTVTFYTNANIYSCLGGSSSASGTTNITAQQAGSQYNLNNASFTVASYPNASGAGSTSGGTDKIIQVVSQSDIQSAQSKIGSADTSSIKSALESQLQQAGYYALPSTFSSGTPSVSSSAQVGAQANNVTVTQTTTYSMFGVHKNDLISLIKSNVDSQIDTSKQAIVDNGLSSASFNVAEQSGGSAQINMQDTASVGPNIDQKSLKKELEGKKSGDAKTLISSIPGVKSVDVRLSPFWVGSVPKNPSKITIIVKKSN